MYGKALFFVVLVVLGAVMPYILADEQWLADIEARFASTETKQENADNPPSATTNATETPLFPIAPPNVPETDTSGHVTSSPPAAPHVPMANPKPYRPRVVGPDLPLEYLLNFEVTPEWISENWQRVSTRLASMNLQGWRVPVARKLGTTTFAGSITYYFDHHRFVQRIVLHGYTGDPQPFVYIASNRYQMKRVPNLVGDLYVAQLKEQVVGALLVQYSAVSERSSEKRCELMMEINRQGSPYGLSFNFSRVLERSRRQLELIAPGDSQTLSKKD